MNRLDRVVCGAVQCAAVAADTLLNLIDDTAAKQARRFTDPASVDPPADADDPAAEIPPDSAAGSLDFQELATSQLLSRAADTIGVVAAAVSFLVSDMAIPEELETFTTELRDRAAQFAAHGD